MKTNKIAVIFIVMVLCIAQAAFSAEEQKPQVSTQVSGTYQASCVIRIIADRQTLSVDRFDEDILSILQSSGIGVVAAKDILGYNAENFLNDEGLNDTIEITSPRLQQGTGNDFLYTFGLKINAPQAHNPAAREYMQALIEGLLQNLNKSFHDYKSRLDRQIEIVQANADKTEKEFYELQERLRKLSGSTDFSRKTIFADINNLQSKIDSLTMDVSNFQEVRNTLASQIERTRQRVAEKLNSDAVLIEMDNMIKKQQQKVDSIKKEIEKANTDPRMASPNLESAETELAKAKIELARRKEEIQQSSGGSRIDSLIENIESYSSRMDITMKLLEDSRSRLSNAKQLLEKADVYEVLLLKADIAKSSLRNALESLDRLKRSADLIPPTVTVMGAD
jgi:hypothetical protein